MSYLIKSLSVSLYLVSICRVVLTTSEFKLYSHVNMSISCCIAMLAKDKVISFYSDAFADNLFRS